MKKKKDETQSLSNFGPKSREWLHSIGIFSVQDIEKVGPFKIYRLLQNSGFPVSLNLLYALVGALQGVHWTLIKENMKEKIMKELETTDNLKYISILRGINVSGSKKLKMDELKKLYESLGYTQVQTYIQSGNVVFESSNKHLPTLKKEITDAIKKSFGYDVDVFVKTKDEWQKLVQNSPFVQKDIDYLHVTFLTEESDTSALDVFNRAKAPQEEFVMAGKVIYLFCPHDNSKTKLNNNV